MSTIDFLCFISVTFSFLFAIVYLYKRVERLLEEVAKLKIDVYTIQTFAGIIDKEEALKRANLKNYREKWRER